jgi:hypothetical protein
MHHESVYQKREPFTLFCLSPRSRTNDHGSALSMLPYRVKMLSGNAETAIMINRLRLQYFLNLDSSSVGHRFTC